MLSSLTPDRLRLKGDQKWRNQNKCINARLPIVDIFITRIRETERER